MAAAVVRVERQRLEGLVARLGHDDTPRVYTDRNVLVRELFWRRLGALLSLSRAPSRARVLDFGGGNGVLMPTLSRLYDEVVCVDLRTEMAEELARADGIANAKIQAGELSSLGLPGDSCDTIIAADVLEHIVDLKALIAEFRRLLKPGGELLVSAPSENAFYELGRKVFRYVKPDDHYHTAAFIERTITDDLRLASRRYFPFNLSPLAVFSLARFVKPDSGAGVRET
ncbi:MAG: class I SAM-dependent methyltransferase [Dehalococcoidia bacterium]